MDEPGARKDTGSGARVGEEREDTNGRANQGGRGSRAPQGWMGLDQLPRAKFGPKGQRGHGHNETHWNE